MMVEEMMSLVQRGDEKISRNYESRLRISLETGYVLEIVLCPP